MMMTQMRTLSYRMVMVLSATEMSDVAVVVVVVRVDVVNVVLSSSLLTLATFVAKNQKIDCIHGRLLWLVV
jgi:hypothetical protein